MPPGCASRALWVTASFSRRCESGGTAHAVSEQAIGDATRRIGRSTGIDAAPEGGAALAVIEQLVAKGTVARDSDVLVFNTGSGASYRV